MRKRLITPIPQDAPPRDEGWLDLDGAAVVEVTSEEKDYPVESALVSGEMRGWRAADPGTQAIRLIFHQPQNWNGWHQCQNRPEPRVLESCFAKLPHGGFVRGSKPFFALDVPRARGSSAALDVRNGRAGRKSRNTFHTVRHDLRTLQSRNQNIPCWPLLGRNSQPHLLNFLFQ